jgi:hypothetical protein
MMPPQAYRGCGGNPYAVLNWDDTITGDDKSVVVELRAVGASLPTCDGDTQPLVCRVYGLKLDGPATTRPLPDAFAAGHGSDGRLISLRHLEQPRESDDR